jgi:hypothetical protein
MHRLLNPLSFVSFQRNPSGRGHLAVFPSGGRRTRSTVMIQMRHFAVVLKNSHLIWQVAGEVLGDQTKQIVEHWRSGIIAGIPHLARHSRSPEGNPLARRSSRDLGDGTPTFPSASDRREPNRGGQWFGGKRMPSHNHDYERSQKNLSTAALLRCETTSSGK